MTALELSNGTYFITDLRGAYLQFSSPDEGMNLTAWHYSGDDEQKWEMAGDGTVYTVMNSKYQNYVASSGTGSPNLVTSNSPFNWYARLMDDTNDTFIFSPDPEFNLTWNVEGGSKSDGTPIILYPSTESLFRVQDPTTTSPKLPPSSKLSRSSIAVIIIGALFSTILLFLVAFFLIRALRPNFFRGSWVFGKHRRKSSGSLKDLHIVNKKREADWLIQDDEEDGKPQTVHVEGSRARGWYEMVPQR